ncbi:predicted protein [Phaeodactylum tricornutum CCAP 1055/1]|jgi:hypothetical protein|uniref:ELMO domain-containing protein n=1 Tax=Phaeodactylum tricornutum (strain CCAP 1055/1) TaxID=556484 RepID=B7GC38_PHATC|nr:predicted protein [Phaeodactylum tricornutum CCAP 1055/1]EEC43708.1 predicted protein [Phaeodactylum tricornutum CCAP 1055/1]|eukprot:XP_002184649.1 predicted protein [Phaeodactylum tricornutum CCAP 1055/1]
MTQHQKERGPLHSTRLGRVQPPARVPPRDFSLVVIDTWLLCRANGASTDATTKRNNTTSSLSSRASAVDPNATTADPYKVYLCVASCWSAITCTGSGLDQVCVTNSHPYTSPPPPCTDRMSGDIPGPISHGSSADGTSSTSHFSSPHKAQQMAQNFAQSASKTLQSWTTRKYTLPDKNVASQVLMYRQLLHTQCRVGLKLSRPYQGTPAQVAVKDMPWWNPGMLESLQMIISYDNLVQRLWLGGAIEPFAVRDGRGIDSDVETYLDEAGMPPIPHDFWVHRVGFQQPDPVTDFRSGGILSLALMVHIVESCPHIHQRFTHGDASVLPFGITSINVTDMMAGFLMLAKKVDRMDALLSQKPFWRMFADPHSLLACQELALDILADVVVELQKTREATETSERVKVTVFDFAWILEQTTHRVEHDLLGAGPKSVPELRAIYGRLKASYQVALQAKIDPDAATRSPVNATATNARRAFSPQVTSSLAGAAQLAGGVWNRFKSNPAEVSSTNTTPVTQPTAVAIPPTASGTPRNQVSSSLSTGPTDGSAPEVDSTEPDDSDWVGTDIRSVTDGVENFSITDDDEEDNDML